MGIYLLDLDIKNNSTNKNVIRMEFCIECYVFMNVGSYNCQNSAYKLFILVYRKEVTCFDVNL